MRLKSPPILHEHFNYTAGVYASSESVYDVEQATPPPGSQVVQSFMVLGWDAYEWHDLVPSGVRAELWLSVGGLFGTDPPQPRHSAELQIDAGLALGDLTVLALRIGADAGTRGNVNYGFVLGSVRGVRGLEEARYFNWLQAFANLELRRSFRLGERSALQVVGFVDGAAFESLNASGGRGGPGTALALGAGLRLVPTWLSSIAPRIDVSRVLTPEPSWFVQLGIHQYF